MESQFPKNYFNSKFMHHYNRIFSDTKKPLVREATDYGSIISVVGKSTVEIMEPFLV
jgi:hypothetical protein